MSTVTRTPLSLVFLLGLLPGSADAQGFGPARPWSASLTAGSLSVVNLSTGNLTTSMTLVDHAPRGGPAARVSLVHNNDAVGWSTPESDLGEGWSISLQASLEGLTDAPSGTLVLGTGETISFTNGDAEAGYDLTLVRDTTSDSPTTAVHDTKGCQMIFEELGGGRARIVESRNAHGFSLTYSYAQNGRLSSVTDRHGRSVGFFDDDADGQFDRIADVAAGSTAEFDLTYDSTGRLENVSHPAGISISFGYLASGEMDWVEDGGDDDGDGQPNRWSFDYAAGWVSKVNDPLPHTTFRSFAYTGTGTSVTDRAGRVTTYTFDGSGNLVKRTDPVGQERVWTRNADRGIETYTDEEDHTWTYERDGFGNVVRFLDPAGIERTALWDDTNRLVSFAGAEGTDLDLHYAHGSFSRWATEVVYPADGFGNPAGSITFTPYPVGHAQAGRLSGIDDLGGVDSAFEYGALGESDETTLGAGHARPVVTQFSWTSGANRVLSVGHVAGTGVTPAGFPELPGPHPQLSGTPSRSAQGDVAWTGEIDEWTTTIDSGIQIPGVGPEPLATTDRQLTYDYLGRVTEWQLSDDQATVDTGAAPLAVTVTTAYHDGVNPAFPHGGREETSSLGETRTYLAGPDGKLASLTSTSGVSRTWSYYADGMLESVTHGSGQNLARVRYEYRPNNQRRVIAVEHTTDGGQTWAEQRRMTSFHNSEGLISANLESTDGVYSALTTYTYDARQQLVHEKRVGQHPYNQAYRYDQAGNRILTIVADSADTVLEFTAHVYDVSAPGVWGSKANRLMYEQTFDGASTHLSTRWYYYDGTFGNPVEIVEGDAGSAIRRGTSLVYAERPQDRLYARSTRLILEREWIADSDGAVVPGSLVWNRAIELRQPNLLVRDAVIERDPVTLAKIPDHPSTSFTLPSLLDYEASAGPISILRTLLGFTSEVSAGNEEHIAADIVGNARWQFTPASGVVGDLVQTAFGVAITQPTSRHAGFSGAVGAESGLLPHGWIRIGARIYNPSNGRWLQSDPIGIVGGFNTYEYSLNSPTLLNDPSGLQSPGPPDAIGQPDLVPNELDYAVFIPAPRDGNPAPAPQGPRPNPMRTLEDLEEFHRSLERGEWPFPEPEPSRGGGGEGGGMTQIDPPMLGYSAPPLLPIFDPDRPRIRVTKCKKVTIRLTGN